MPTWLGCFHRLGLTLEKGICFTKFGEQFFVADFGAVLVADLWKNTTTINITNPGGVVIQIWRFVSIRCLRVLAVGGQGGYLL